MRKRFSTKNHSEIDTEINITAMADIFTVLLVFLLKSFSSGFSTLVPPAGIEIPSAMATKVAPESLKVEISSSSIAIDGKKVLGLQGFILPQNEILADGTLKSVAIAFDEQRKKRLKTLELVKKDRDLSSTNEKQNSLNNQQMILVSDKGTPYEVIKPILASAAVSGFTDIKLLVIDRSKQ